MTSIINPFINTCLHARIALHPSQLNNNIYSNLKQNLIRQLDKKCYLDYGYISEIYEILERDSGSVLPEDTQANVEFNIKFSCRLCQPIENTQIICKVHQISDVFIILNRDPIRVIVTTEGDRINKGVFYKDTSDKKIKLLSNNQPLEQDAYVKVTILSKTAYHKDKKILAIGRLDDIASESEIHTYYEASEK